MNYPGQVLVVTKDLIPFLKVTKVKVVEQQLQENQDSSQTKDEVSLKDDLELKPKADIETLNIEENFLENKKCFDAAWRVLSDDENIAFSFFEIAESLPKELHQYLGNFLQEKENLIEFFVNVQVCENVVQSLREVASVPKKLFYAILPYLQNRLNSVKNCMENSRRKELIDSIQIEINENLEGCEAYNKKMESNLDEDYNEKIKDMLCIFINSTKACMQELETIQAILVSLY